MLNNNVVRGIIEGTGDIASLVSGPLFPVTYGAKELLKYSYDFLSEEEAKKNQYKPGNWYANPDFIEDLYAKGGPSTKYVPLSPDVDPGSWTPAGRKVWEDANKGISGPTGKAPLSNLHYGWTEHYAPQIPVVKIDRSKGRVNLHPPATSNPNATMVPSGGFSNYRKKRY